MRREPVLLIERLRERLPEIERAVLTRAYAIADATDVADPTYLRGLSASVSAALDHGLAVLLQPSGPVPPVPVPLLAQARIAARSGVSLDTVLRRYFAGYQLFTDLLVSEVTAGDAELGSELRSLLAALAVAFERLLAEVSTEFRREAVALSGGSEQRRAERVEGLLNGELLDHSTFESEFAYNLDRFHIGVLAVGPSASAAICEFAAALGTRLLLVSRPEQTVWAWFGARRDLDPLELESLFNSTRPPNFALAIGEPATGHDGWCLTHRQAVAALPIALRADERLARYSKVALIASICEDDLLATSLRQLFLEPLDRGRGGGVVARETLRAYFEAGGSASSAAAALKVNRHTVASRIRAIEAKLGRPLHSCFAEIEAALKLEEFREVAGPSA